MELDPRLTQTLPRQEVSSVTDKPSALIVRGNIAMSGCVIID